ncbi:hypothetical protein GCM10010232_18700 [Streptomyces amakusaensis]|uniref:Secreted protein n=1 Tax=Streptomyces amakusaensis TaxID=67271 RepID=A0ABW0AS19_9ACTN
MQTSALPDLAHNRSRPVHWLATAAATAAVVALAGLLQPGAATASQPDRAAPAAGRPAPDVRTPLPLECGSVPSAVVREAVGDLDGDGGLERVVVARCQAGSGTPPSGIYVLAAGRDGTGRVVATLIGPERRQSVERLAIRNGTISAALLGYSSDQVPSCCPDEREEAEWRWSDGKFLRTAPDEARPL